MSQVFVAKELSHIESSIREKKKPKKINTIAHQKTACIF